MSSAIARLDLPAQTPASTSGKARDMLESSQRNLGFVPNMYANMANSPGLLQTYLLGACRRMRRGLCTGRLRRTASPASSSSFGSQC